MKLTRSFVAVALSFSLCLTAFLSFPVASITARDYKVALQRGYRTGYSDGYMSGYRDAVDNAVRGFDRQPEYKSADRAYSTDYGSLDDYRDGYRQGFESGYNTGFEKRSFDATVPADLQKRENYPLDQAVTVTPQNAGQPVPTSNAWATDDRVVIIPVETELILELTEQISTDDNKNGDKFVARVVSPVEIAGATVEGRINRLQKPGRIKRRSELGLSFDLIRLSEARWSNYNAMLTEVLPIKGDNVRRVDTEGTMQGKSTVKDDSIKLGVTTGSGAVVGAVVGGPVGMAVGAGVGAAFGVGAVVVERGKHIKLARGQQLRVKTAYETQIR